MSKKKTGRGESATPSAGSPVPAAPTQPESDLRKRAEEDTRANQAKAPESGSVAV
jgi:hypothetical protein